MLTGIAGSEGFAYFVLQVPAACAGALCGAWDSGARISALHLVFGMAVSFVQLYLYRGCSKFALLLFSAPAADTMAVIGTQNVSAPCILGCRRHC